MGSEGRWPAVSGGPPDTFVHFFNPPFRGLEMRVLEFSPGRRKQPAGRRRSPRKGLVPAKFMATFAGMSTGHRIKDCDAMWFRWFQFVAAPNCSPGQVVKLCETRPAPGPASLAWPGLFPSLNVPG